MKKNIDKNKISNFKNYDPSYHHHSTFCMKTKPNNRYFKEELKKITQEMRNDLCTEELKQNDPIQYYSLMGKKLPKKYWEKPTVHMAPVNASVPPQSLLSKEELEVLLEKEMEERRINQEKLAEEKKLKRIEDERIERNRAAALRERSLIYWTNPHDQGNYRSIHSEEYQRKVNKKTPFYY